MRDDADYEDETAKNINQPEESDRVSDEAVTKGRDVQDASRDGATHGTDVLEDEDVGEVETIGETVVDHSRAAETHGVDVIDEGPLSESTDEDVNH